MNDGQTLAADAQLAEVVKPGNGSFDDPSRFSQTAAVRFAATCDQGFDSGSVERPAILIVIVATVGLNQQRFGQRTSPLAANRRNCVDKRQQLGDVVAVGAGQDYRERDALPLGDEVVLGAWASAIGRVRSCF